MTAIQVLRLLPILTPRRLLNVLLLQFSFVLSRIAKRAIHFGKPMGISFEPTTTCNLSCTECPTGLKQLKRPKGRADLRLFKQLMDEVSASLMSVIFYFQGEPFLHPGFCEFVSYARYKKLFTITSTNGHFLSKEAADNVVKAGLNRLIVSVDGPKQESYAQYRQGGNLQKVLEGIQHVQAAKQKHKAAFPEIVMQFLVFRITEKYIPEMKALAKRHNVRLSIKSAQIYGFETAHHLVPEQAQYARYRLGPDGRFVIKSDLANRCWRMWSSAVITWNGDVIPCCFDKDARYKRGNIQVEGLHTVWQSHAYENFREKILSSRNQIDMCKNCSEGLKLKC